MNYNTRLCAKNSKIFWGGASPSPDPFHWGGPGNPLLRPHPLRLLRSLNFRACGVHARRLRLAPQKSSPRASDSIRFDLLHVNIVLHLHLHKKYAIMSIHNFITDDTSEHLSTYALLVMLRFSDCVSWIVIQLPDSHELQIAIPILKKRTLLLTAIFWLRPTNTLVVYASSPM